MTPEILQLRDNLIAARQSVDTYKELTAPIEAEMNEAINRIREDFGMRYAEVFENAEAAQNNLTETETTLRDALCRAYETFGEKQIADGLSVRVNTRLEYDSATALTWAKDHQLCLTLDKPAFEKIAKVQDLDFVTTIETPTAVIAKELT